MKKFLKICLILGLCIGLSGCRDKNNKETQTKVENAGYSIVLNKDVGTAIAEIYLKDGDSDYFSLTIDKESGNVSSVDFVVDLGTSLDYISYNVDDFISFGNSYYRENK